MWDSRMGFYGILTSLKSEEAVTISSYSPHIAILEYAQKPDFQLFKPMCILLSRLGSWRSEKRVHLCGLMYLLLSRRDSPSLGPLRLESQHMMPLKLMPLSIPTLLHSSVRRCSKGIVLQHADAHIHSTPVLNHQVPFRLLGLTYDCHDVHCTSSIR